MPYRRRAPAKINLGLHILRRRTDGYHDIESVLVPIDWHDVLTYEPSEQFRFTCSDPSLPTDERNLCVLAARRLANRAGVQLRGRLHLDKHLPHGAGLGGGSSDAAHTLRLLTDAWGLECGNDDLHPLAADLGSDVPFFLYDAPMLATGRGDILNPIGTPRALVPFPVTVVVPSVTIRTEVAYQLVEPWEEGRPDLHRLVCAPDLGNWARFLTNDFQTPILARYPEVASEYERMAGSGAGFVSVSGSGSAVFGLFEQEEAAAEAERHARSRGLTAWCGYVLSRDR